MKINTKIVLKNLKGEPLKTDSETPLTVGEALSNILLFDKAGGKMKCFILAEKCYKQNAIEIDEADFSLIKDSVGRSEAYPSSIVTGQLLVFLEGLKEVEKKEEIKEEAKK